MGMYIRQENNRTKLQEQIAADLAKKARNNSLDDNGRPDGVDDSAYLEKTKSTTSLAWVWVIVGFLFVVTLVWLAVVSL